MWHHIPVLRRLEPSRRRAKPCITCVAVHRHMMGQSQRMEGALLLQNWSKRMRSRQRSPLISLGSKVILACQVNDWREYSMWNKHLSTNMRNGARIGEKLVAGQQMNQRPLAQNWPNLSLIFSMELGEKHWLKVRLHVKVSKGFKASKELKTWRRLGGCWADAVVPGRQETRTLVFNRNFCAKHRNCIFFACFCFTITPALPAAKKVRLLDDFSSSVLASFCKNSLLRLFPFKLGIDCLLGDWIKQDNYTLVFASCGSFVQGAIYWHLYDHHCRYSQRKKGHAVRHCAMLCPTLRKRPRYYMWFYVIWFYHFIPSCRCFLLWIDGFMFLALFLSLRWSSSFWLRSPRGRGLLGEDVSCRCFLEVSEQVNGVLLNTHFMVSEQDTWRILRRGFVMFYIYVHEIGIQRWSLTGRTVEPLTYTSTKQTRRQIRLNPSKTKRKN